VDARVRGLLQGGGGGWGEAPSPSSLESAVRASHAAMAVGAPAASALAASTTTGATDAGGASAPGVIFSGESVAANAAAAHAAALESTMLFGRSGNRWLESVRLSARGALVLATVTSAVYAAAPPQGGVRY
jgi:hypothetical protein